MTPSSGADGAGDPAPRPPSPAPSPGPRPSPPAARPGPTLAPLYLLRGLRLLGAPGVRRFVWIPLAVNVAVFGALGWWLDGLLTGWLDTAPLFAGDDAFVLLRWLGNVIDVLAAIVLVIALAWVYTLVANVIGAPFNGLLAERVESHLTGRPPPPGGTFTELLRAIPRTLRSEIAKIAYLLAWAIPLLLLPFVPVVNVASPAIVALFAAWVFSLEYLDYPMGNRGALFGDVRRAAGKRRATALGFGGAVALASAVPLANLVVMPAAVAGATALYLDRWAETDA